MITLYENLITLLLECSFFKLCSFFFWCSVKTICIVSSPFICMADHFTNFVNVNATINQSTYVRFSYETFPFIYSCRNSLLYL